MKKYFTIIALGILILASGDSYLSSALLFPKANIYQSIERAEALAQLTPLNIQRILHNRGLNEQGYIEQSGVPDGSERAWVLSSNHQVTLASADISNHKCTVRKKSFTQILLDTEWWRKQSNCGFNSFLDPAIDLGR